LKRAGAAAAGAAMDEVTVQLHKRFLPMIAKESAWLWARSDGSAQNPAI
jgi:hypothetical protein